MQILDLANSIIYNHVRQFLYVYHICSVSLESPDTLVNKRYKHSSTDINFEDHITGFLPPFILYNAIYDQLLPLGPHTFFFYEIIPPTIPWTYHDIWTKMHAPHLEYHFISLNNSPIRSTSRISCFNNYKPVFQIYFGWWVGGQEKEKKRVER